MEKKRVSEAEKLNIKIVKNIKNIIKKIKRKDCNNGKPKKT